MVIRIGGLTRHLCAERNSIWTNDGGVMPSARPAIQKSRRRMEFFDARNASHLDGPVMGADRARRYRPNRARSATVGRCGGRSRNDRVPTDRQTNPFLLLPREEVAQPRPESRGAVPLRDSRYIFSRARSRRRGLTILGVLVLVKARALAALVLVDAAVAREHGVPGRRRPRAHCLSDARDNATRPHGARMRAAVAKHVLVAAR